MPDPNPAAVFVDASAAQAKADAEKDAAAAKLAEKPKIPLKFVKKHIHNGKEYKVGQTEKFTQKDADLIRSTGSVVDETAES